MHCITTDDAIRIFESGDIHNLEEADLKHLHHICVSQVGGTPAKQAKISLIAETVLSRLAQLQQYRLETQIECLSYETTALLQVSQNQLNQIAALTKASENQLETSNALVAEATTTTKLSRVLVFLTVALTLLTLILAIPIVKEWVKPSHNEIRLIIDHPNTNAVMQITFPAFPSDNQLKNQLKNRN